MRHVPNAQQQEFGGLLEASHDTTMASSHYDALPSPGLNPLEGSTMCSCGKLGLEGRSRLLALKRGRGVC
jgi:hypothetical protein